MMTEWCNKTFSAVKDRTYHKLKKDIHQINALINTFSIVIFQVCNRLRWNGRRIKQKKNDPVSCFQRTSESRSTFAIKTMYTLQYTYNVFTQFTNLFCYMSWTLTCKKKKCVFPFNSWLILVWKPGHPPKAKTMSSCLLDFREVEKPQPVPK